MAAVVGECGIGNRKWDMCDGGRWGRPETGGVATSQVKGRVCEEGDRQYENIILANYSLLLWYFPKIL